MAGGADGSPRPEQNGRHRKQTNVRTPTAGLQHVNMSIQIERWSEQAAPVAQELRKRLEGEGFSVFQWSDEPGTKYGPHAHAEDQSHWIVSGELELRVGHEIYTLRAGDRDLLPANTMHSAFVPGDAPVTYLIGAKH